MAKFLIFKTFLMGRSATLPYASNNITKVNDIWASYPHQTFRECVFNQSKHFTVSICISTSIDEK